MIGCAVALALLMDTSASVDKRRFELQRDGTAAGIESAEFARSLELVGPVAIVVVQWSNTSTVVVPWTVVSNAKDASEVALRLRGSERVETKNTGIGDAVFSQVLRFRSAPCVPTVKIIDVSGDGPENIGMRARDARDVAVSEGIRVNGLPIVTSDEPGLAEYYATSVVTPDGFSVVAEGWDTFTEAMRRKLVLEMAGAKVLPPG